MTEEPLARRVGVVVVHGVQPHPRYEIQDLCAQQLATALAADPFWSTVAHGKPWVFSVLDPEDTDVAKTCQPLPTISRVRVDGNNPQAPADPYFDIIEAYWSPLDKGKATFAGILAWLLQTIFVPLNTTARYMSSRGKTLFDVGLVVLGILAVVGGLLGALFLAVLSLEQLTSSNDFSATLWKVLDEKTLLAAFTPAKLAVLAFGLAGAYLAVQAMKAGLGALGQLSELTGRHRAQGVARLRLIVITLLVGAAMLIAMAYVPAFGPVSGWVAVWFVLAAGAFVGGRTVAQSFFVNFFADVQIYTTRDENVTFNAMRDEILDLVTRTIVTTAGDGANRGQGYDRVYVLGHSLGSTIALDALLRFHAMVKQDPGNVALRRSFERIRGFVTFGSPLEKTKYFFDVLHPSPSLSFEQWRSDAYGPLFSADARVLDPPAPGPHPMFWVNYWYPKDPVCNELSSYRSFVPAGGSSARGHHLRAAFARRPPAIPTGSTAIGRPVSWNERGSRGFVYPGIVPHGEYLLDPWFWHTENPVLARRAPAAVAPGGPATPPIPPSVGLLPAGEPPGGGPPTGEAPFFVGGPHIGVLDVIARTTASPGRTREIEIPALATEDGATYVLVPAAEGRCHVLRYDPAEH
jgi:pimeloyl-ACP methyl ester carboxylesterase